jgi:hypothetical protein
MAWRNCVATFDWLYFFALLSRTLISLKLGAREAPHTGKQHQRCAGWSRTSGSHDGSGISWPLAAFSSRGIAVPKPFEILRWPRLRCQGVNAARWRDIDLKRTHYTIPIRFAVNPALVYSDASISRAYVARKHIHQLRQSTPLLLNTLNKLCV